MLFVSKETMNDEELKKIGEWLNTKGHGIDLTDDSWMDNYEWCEYKTRDICQMLFDYHFEQCKTDESHNNMAVCANCGAKAALSTGKLCYGCWMLRNW